MTTVDVEVNEPPVDVKVTLVPVTLPSRARSPVAEMETTPEVLAELAVSAVLLLRKSPPATALLTVKLEIEVNRIAGRPYPLAVSTSVPAATDTLFEL